MDGRSRRYRDRRTGKESRRGVHSDQMVRRGQKSRISLPGPSARRLDWTAGTLQLHRPRQVGSR